MYTIGTLTISTFVNVAVTREITENRKIRVKKITVARHWSVSREEAEEIVKLFRECNSDLEIESEFVTREIID